MTTLHLTIPTDLENELAKLQTDIEVVVIKAIRQYVSSNNFNASEQDLEMSAILDNSDDFLTPKELDYYLAL